NATIQFAFAVSPTQPYLAYGALDHTVNVIDLNNTQTVHQINIAPATATVTAFDPSGRRLACGTQTGHVFVYEQADSASEYRLLYHIQHTTTPIWRLLFSPNGEKVAWNCAGQEIRCLDLKSGQVSPVIPTYYGAFCLGFSQDSTQLFTDGPNHALLVRDPMSGKIHRTLYGHSAGLTSIEVSPAGDKVATSSGDGSIRLWDTHSGDCLAVLQFTGPYAGMNITGAIGISNTQHQALLALGAIDENPRALQSLA
ncbi:MAG: hypothetical protein KDE54_00775, partial [Caldilineaceae bacterium]|nr:hypothetical protein [Caldilineaceae bacterium]